MTHTDLTEAEINRRLAESMGWEWVGLHDGLIDAYWHDASGQRHFLPMFSPATSGDHLRLYVLPELERRGLGRALMDSLCDSWDGDSEGREGDMDFAMWCMNLAPAVLARAALDILKSQET